MQKIWIIYIYVFSTVVISASSKLVLEDIFVDAVFYPDRLNIKPLKKDSCHYFSYLYKYREVVKCSFIDSTYREVLISVRDLINDSIKYIWDYQVSDNEKYILFSTDFEQKYRYSGLFHYYIFNTINKELFKINNEFKISYAELSPDNNHVAYTVDNNIYIMDLRTKMIQQVTSDGKKNIIINGSPDWLYEEEFSLKKGFYWSPDGDKIAFYRFDESKVKSYIIQKYDSIYPTMLEYKYPKAGEQNPVLDIIVYDLADKKNVKINIGEEKDIYIPRIKWTPWKDTLSVVRLNRLQNNIEIILTDVNNGDSKVIYNESSDTYFNNPDDNYLFFLDKERKLILSSEKDGFNQLYLYSVNGDSIKRLDNSGYDVNELLGFNDVTKEIIYSSFEKNPTENHIFSVNIITGQKNLLTDKAGWNEAVLSSNADNYIISYSSANKPDSYKVVSTKNGQNWNLLVNERINKSIKTFNYSPKEFIKVETENGIFNAYVIKPDVFNTKKKYPLLIYVYGGPGSQQVTNKWNGYRDEWFQFLTQKGYIVACMDNRGTGGRGKEFKNCIYGRLGSLEVDDQIAFARYMSRQSYIDKNRIGIFGWSHGGYMTLLCLEKGSDIYKTGICVAPLTHWRFYDTAFTERYMKRPDENEKGYFSSSPLNYVSEIKNRFLLVHGTYDDNVHFQHSAELIKELVRLNKPYDLLLFPDSNHNINNGNSLLYLYQQMTDYIIDNL